MKELVVLKVEWIDASSDPVWRQLDELKGDESPTISIGILARETRKALYITTTYDPESKCVVNTKFIPKGMIVKRKILCKIPMR